MTPDARMTSLEDIAGSCLEYVADLRVVRGGECAGYRHSHAVTEPVVYALAAALLIKHLLGVADAGVTEELDLLCSFQSDDGLFRDPAVACKTAETEVWWGWTHLTLHALMTLALHGRPAPRGIAFLDRFRDKDRLRSYLLSRDWGERAAWTSNELQNLGVMLQYARDYQGWKEAEGLLRVLYEVIAAKQDPATGLFGHRFDTRATLSLGVQAGYHFWLLQLYDGIVPDRAERIIDSILALQNPAGSYGERHPSSACEDIDAIDPLLRLSRLTAYRRDEVLASLARALPTVMASRNADGGWVFRRDEDLTVVHPQMYSAANQSNLFFSWFRLLGLAYCLKGLGEAAEVFHFSRAPGHQFL